MKKAILAVLVLGVAGEWSASRADTTAEKTATPWVRSRQSGLWSAADTWEGGKIPAALARVQIRTGHAVVYDVKSDQVVRTIHIAGTLTFARDRDTLLNVGLIKIQAGEMASEDGFDCDAHLAEPNPKVPRPALEVGTPNQPMSAGRTAMIRLVFVEGHDRQSCPAIVCCGGRMDFHGTPLSRTWVKLAATASPDTTEVTLEEPVTGWKAGDRIILTATTRQNKGLKTFKPSVKDYTQTEERLIKAVNGNKITLDQNLKFTHLGEGDYRGEIANLSRNVVVESADPAKARGHTMYHRGSAGAISYAEFRHLGMPGVLGRYSLHYHLAGDSMRGSYVQGASIWDSGNRWLTIHGTNYLVVRDCVGYQSMGHGFFLEDGTEVYNVLDRNLAVQAFTTKPLPKQIIPFDKNDGSGFWWANCHNTFTANVACDCDEYGYFFQAAKTAGFDPNLKVMQPDGSKARVDIRTLPFIRFEDNVAHCQRRHAFNLGGGAPFGPPNVDNVGPDEKHPFVIRNTKLYNVHWAFHPVSPSVLVDNMDIKNADYGIWRPVYQRHAYAKLAMAKVPDNTAYAFEQGTRPTPADFPRPLDPVDDLAPITVITHVRPVKDGILVRGTTSDNGTVAKVLVNGLAAKAQGPNFMEWEITLPAQPKGRTVLSAHAEDGTGNVEKRAHQVEVP